jgi:Spy/CpxP family protein refolding chaperone
MRNKTLFTIATIATLTIGGFAAYSLKAAPLGGGKPGQRPIMQRIMSELDLSEDQITKIKGELSAEKENIKPLLLQLHETRKSLRETMQANGDEAAIRAAFAKVADVEEELTVQRAKIRSNISPILTEEQQNKLKVIEEKMDEFVINAIKNIGSRLE